ncbi:MAG: atpH [Gammaproteobacteria bacterium]|jgi:F-type H+-transporting ATPase subunit delta|nr:atpH [Gammaproteobacteria bacterium]
MQESTTLARPYAKAAFEYALAHGQLSVWSAFLQRAAAIVNDPQVTKVLVDPRITREQAYQLLSGLCQGELDEPQHNNLLHLLAENRRLGVLPEIATLFGKLCAEHEQTLQVQVITVIELNKEQQDKLIQALQQRLARKIILNFSQDAALLGGLLIRAGDKVIDLSLRGQLQRLNSKLRIA